MKGVYPCVLSSRVTTCEAGEWLTDVGGRAGRVEAEVSVVSGDAEPRLDPGSRRRRHRA